jgi:hypothetical protein
MILMALWETWHGFVAANAGSNMNAYLVRRKVMTSGKLINRWTYQGETFEARMYPDGFGYIIDTDMKYPVGHRGYDFFFSKRGLKRLIVKLGVGTGDEVKMKTKFKITYSRGHGESLVDCNYAIRVVDTTILRKHFDEGQRILNRYYFVDSVIYEIPQILIDLVGFSLDRIDLVHLVVSRSSVILRITSEYGDITETEDLDLEGVIHV